MVTSQAHPNRCLPCPAGQGLRCTGTSQSVPLQRWVSMTSYSKLIIPSASMKLKGGYTGGYTGFTLSVCEQNRVHSVSFQQYSSDPFHICTSYQATSGDVSYVMFVSKFKNLKFCQILYMCNFHFVFFWLGIQYDSMVWVIMRWWGVSSERRRSSCLWETWMKI